MINLGLLRRWLSNSPHFNLKVGRRGPGPMPGPPGLPSRELTESPNNDALHCTKWNTGIHWVFLRSICECPLVTGARGPARQCAPHRSLYLLENLSDAEQKEKNFA